MAGAPWPAPHSTHPDCQPDYLTTVLRLQPARVLAPILGPIPEQTRRAARRVPIPIPVPTSSARPHGAGNGAGTPFGLSASIRGFVKVLPGVRAGGKAPRRGSSAGFELSKLLDRVVAPEEPVRRDYGEAVPGRGLVAEGASDASGKVDGARLVDLLHARGGNAAD